MNTKEKILNASRELFQKKGYHQTTTKEIAKKAGVNEVTIFRKFKTKKGLFEAGYKHFYYEPNAKELENYKLLEPSDFLNKLGNKIYEILVRNEFVLLSAIRSEDQIIKSVLKNHPKELQEEIVTYFLNKSDLNKEELKIKANNFLLSIFGFFMCNHVVDIFKSSHSFESALEEMIKSFLKE